MEVLLAFISAMALLIIFFPPYSTCATPRCLPQESRALIELKRGFSGDYLWSWPAGTDCCNWEDIACDPDTSMVIELDLSNRGMSGTISHGLFNLTALRRLDLSNNYFDWSLFLDPPFERLSNLTYLNLSAAGLTDKVPSGISRLSKLISLDLSSNPLELPNSDLKALIGRMRDLKTLVLNSVNISSNGTEWCRAISESVPGIEILSLSDCVLSGPIDASLSQLRSISVLRLGGNNFSTNLPNFLANFASLKELDLSDCNLDGSFPKSIFRLPNLMSLDVSRNDMLTVSFPEFPTNSILEKLVIINTNISGTLPSSISNLRSLKTLRLINNKNLSGTVPELANWVELEELEIQNNRLTGPLPSSFGRLSKLRILDLSYNLLSGSLPNSLFALPSLESMYLNHNQFSGTMNELSLNSSVLSIIHLEGNRIQGAVPRSIFKISSITDLSLASNNFSGEVGLELFAALKNLSYLDLSNNILWFTHQISGSSPFLPKLKVLGLGSCNLTEIPEFLRHQGEIYELDLSNNRITGDIPYWSTINVSRSLNLSHNSFTNIQTPIPKMPASVIDISNNMLQGPVPLPKLGNRFLDYSNNKFSSIPSTIGTYLTSGFYSLANNNLNGQIPSSICKVVENAVLDFSYNNFTGPIPTCLFEKVESRSVLNFRRNMLHGTLPEINPSKISSCGLNTLNLNDNKLEGGVPKWLAKCDELEVLDLGNNKLSGPFPFWLGTIPNLKILILKSNQFGGYLDPPPRLLQDRGTFSNLKILDVSSNKFSGSLPSQLLGDLEGMTNSSDVSDKPIGRLEFSLRNGFAYQDKVSVTFKGNRVTLTKILTIFTYIDVSVNRFKGGIPEVIGNLKTLRLLNLSHNALSGPIPATLKGLVQLESLDLSRNRLSGEIPRDLNYLNFLSFLNLSYNDLVGKIPQGGQFLTFSIDSFKGNEGLCGQQVNLRCETPISTPISERQVESSKPDMEVVWQWMAVGLGYGVGFALSIVLQAMWTRRRREEGGSLAIILRIRRAIARNQTVGRAYVV